LLIVWSRYPPNTKSFLGKWWFWFVISTLTMLFPLFGLFHQILFPHSDFDWISRISINMLAVLTGALAILAQIYHYSSFYYGRPSFTGALDPIGMGIPTRVNLFCDKEISTALK